MAKTRTGTKSKRTTSARKKQETEQSERLFNWLSEGYEVSELTKLIKTGKKSEIRKAFSEYENNISRLQELKKELEELDINKQTKNYIKIKDMLNNPNSVEDIEKFIKSVKYIPKIQELKAELASLNVTGFVTEAAAINAKFDDPSLLDEIEKDIKILRRKIKEKFFESAFESELRPGDRTEVGVVAKAPVAETIFFIHRDGTLLSVKSRISPDKLNKKLLSRMVMAIREQMNRAFEEGEHVHRLTYEGHSIILEDSNHVYAAVVIAGEEKPIMYKIILKALQIMEKKFAREFQNWTGDRKKLVNVESYSTAIFQAFDKLNQ